MRKLFLLLLICAQLFNTSIAQPITSVALFKVSATAGSSYETETTTYLTAMATAGASFTTAQKDSINRFFKDIKGQSNPRYTTYNVLSKITIIYPFLTGVSATDKINMVNPGTYNYTETGSPTYSTSTLSVAFNGTTQYLNTGHTPNGSATLAGSDFTAFAYHRIDANTDGNATMGEVGGGNSYVQILNAGVKFMVLCGSTANSSSNAQATARLWWASWSTSSAVNAYYNATLMTSTSTSYGNTPTRSVLIGAFNSAVVGFGGACTVDTYFEGTSTWSDNEEAFMYNALKALRGSFGITWN